jgi:hypothetical protein
MEAQKIQAVLDWPLLRTVRAVQGFLGLAGYYRRFIKDYDAIATPLTALLRKDSFRWSPEAEKAFRTLQRALTTAPVLQLPDFTKDFVVECDASGSGMGAVLHQGSGPVAFFSRQLAPQHTKLVAYERELIGLVQAVKHWRPYLWGDPFLIKIDHFSLKYLLDQRLATIPQHQWASKLIGFDFKVEFKPGSSNVVADALSRRDTEEEAAGMALSIPSFQLFDDIRDEFDKDPDLQALKNEVQADSKGDQWNVLDGLITVKGKIYVPASSPTRLTLLDHAHGMGHEGTEKTLNRFRAD